MAKQDKLNTHLSEKTNADFSGSSNSNLARCKKQTNKTKINKQTTNTVITYTCIHTVSGINPKQRCLLHILQLTRYKINASTNGYDYIAELKEMASDWLENLWQLNAFWVSDRKKNNRKSEGKDQDWWGLTDQQIRKKKPRHNKTTKLLNIQLA